MSWQWSRLIPAAFSDEAIGIAKVKAREEGLRVRRVAQVERVEDAWLVTLAIDPPGGVKVTIIRRRDDA
jgi:hypothetical protein